MTLLGLAPEEHSSEPVVPHLYDSCRRIRIIRHHVHGGPYSRAGTGMRMESAEAELLHGYRMPLLSPKRSLNH